MSRVDSKQLSPSETASSSVHERLRYLSGHLVAPWLWSVRCVSTAKLDPALVGGLMAIAGVLACAFVTLYSWRLSWDRKRFTVGLVAAAAELCFFVSLASLPLLSAVALNAVSLVFRQLATSLFVWRTLTARTYTGLALSLSGALLAVVHFQKKPFSVASLKLDRWALTLCLCSALLSWWQRSLNHQIEAANPSGAAARCLSPYLADILVGVLYSTVRCAVFSRHGDHEVVVWRWSTSWSFVVASVTGRFISLWTEASALAASSPVSDAYAILWTVLWTLFFARDDFQLSAAIGGCFMITGLAVMSTDYQTSPLAPDATPDDAASDVAAFLLQTHDLQPM